MGYETEMDNEDGIEMVSKKQMKKLLLGESEDEEY